MDMVNTAVITLTTSVQNQFSDRIVVFTGCELYPQAMLLITEHSTSIVNQLCPNDTLPLLCIQVPYNNTSLIT